MPNCGEERKNGRYQIVCFRDDMDMTRSDRDSVIRGHNNNNNEQQVSSKICGKLSRCTVGQNNQKPRRKYWATHSSARSLAHFAHCLVRGEVNDGMTMFSAFFSILARNEMEHITAYANSVVWTDFKYKDFRLY